MGNSTIDAAWIGAAHPLQRDCAAQSVCFEAVMRDGAGPAAMDGTARREGAGTR